MLPIPTIEQPESGREAIKRDFYNLDNLIGELNVQKEQISNVRPGQSAAAPGSTNDLLNDDSDLIKEPMPAGIAALSGKAIAGTIDTVLSTGFSIYAKAPTAEKYEATEKQIEKLNAAWAAVAQKYNYQVADSPWINVALLTTAVYLPIYKEAQKDHRFAEMDEKLQAMEKLIQENEARLKVVEAQKAVSNGKI